MRKHTTPQPSGPQFASGLPRRVRAKLRGDRRDRRRFLEIRYAQTCRDMYQTGGWFADAIKYDLRAWGQFKAWLRQTWGRIVDRVVA